MKKLLIMFYVAAMVLAFISITKGFDQKLTPVILAAADGQGDPG